MRPSPPIRHHEYTTTQSYTTTDMTSGWSSPFTSEIPISSTSTYWPTVNDSSTIDPSYYDDLNATVIVSAVTVRTTRTATSPTTMPITSPITSPSPSPSSNPSTTYHRYERGEERDCTLLKYETVQDYIRFGTEIGVLAGMALYMIAAAREARFLGRKMFFENLVNIWESSIFSCFKMYKIFVWLCLGHCSVACSLSDFLQPGYRHDLLAHVLSEGRGRYRRRARDVIYCAIFPFFLQVTQKNATGY